METELRGHCWWWISHGQIWYSADDGRASGALFGHYSVEMHTYIHTYIHTY